jgi:hypothetical protein
MPDPGPNASGDDARAGNCPRLLAAPAAQSYECDDQAHRLQINEWIHLIDPLLLRPRAPLDWRSARARPPS